MRAGTRAEPSTTVGRWFSLPVGEVIYKWGVNERPELPIRLSRLATGAGDLRRDLAFLASMPAPLVRRRSS